MDPYITNLLLIYIGTFCVTHTPQGVLNSFIRPPVMCVIIRIGAVPQSGAYFGEGSDPIHLDYVQCSGTEYDLMECKNANSTRKASHLEDVGVQCQPG